jgi:two-component system, chemotaxis family, protein-glutamate methylesterase/glutaminase
VRGPAENGSRPSIDVLFRSAATTFAAAACGVLLSGTLDDGVAGLVQISRAGGLALVQDPDDAQYGDMPNNALATREYDAAYPASEIVPAIQRWLGEPHPNGVLPQAPDERVAGVPSVFSCPDCGGTLWELDDEAILRFRCRTGHAFNPQTMLASQGDNVEFAMWAALRALAERRSLLRKLAARSRTYGHLHAAASLERQAEEVAKEMLPIEVMLQRGPRAVSVSQ